MAAEKKQVRVWADGCFDFMHFGHANSLRQAKSLGDYLIVGVHSDEDITKNKGPPVMSEDERYEAVLACKWVDEVYKAAPYTTSLAVMDEADFCVHGDDIVTNSDGVDCYHEVKQVGRFKTVPRTEGVSTTAIVGRMLHLTQEHKDYSTDVAALKAVPPGEAVEMAEGAGGKPSSSPYTGVQAFLPSTRRLVQFASSREPKPGDRIGYVDGSFDLFHIGHIRFLKKAREQCDFLIVGVHDDKTVNEEKKGNWPVMNIHERVLGVLSCKYVDEVIIGAPAKVSDTMIKHNKITIVMCGSTVDQAYKAQKDDPYELPKKLNIFKLIESPSTLTTSDIVTRIIKHREAFENRNKKKEAKEIKEFGKLLHT